jgi:hypothetical protein
MINGLCARSEGPVLLSRGACGQPFGRSFPNARTDNHQETYVGDLAQSETVASERVPRKRLDVFEINCSKSLFYCYGFDVTIVCPWEGKEDW